jgi:hypothetical protein
MKTILIAGLLVAVPAVQGQAPAPIDAAGSAPTDVSSVAAVRAELEEMFETDQSHRREVIELEKKHGRDSKEVKEAWAKQKAIDAHNIRRLEAIVEKHGWPGSTLFGNKAATAAFLILQHSEISYQKKHLARVREAAAKGEVRASSLALLEDRVRLREGQKQIYGSQVTRNSAGEWEPLPLEDADTVDTRRAGVGLGPIAEYLQGFAERSGGAVSPRWRKPSEGGSGNASGPTPTTLPPPVPQEGTGR